MGVDSWPTGGPVVHRADPTRRGRPGAAASDYYVNAPAVPQRPHGGVPATTALPHAPARPGPSARHRVRRDETSTPSGGPLGDRRGLTAAGALVLLLVFGGIGAGLDRLLGHGFWIFFSVGFVAAVLLNALRIHLEDLVASIVLVPIGYALLGAVSSLLNGGGSGLKQHAIDAAGVLILGAPILLLSLAVALLVAGGRARAATVARRRARARAARRYGALPPGSRNRRSTGTITRRAR